MTSAFDVSTRPQFNGENYQFWVVKLQSYLKTLALWKYVLNDADPPPLGGNPILNQIKQYERGEIKEPQGFILYS